MANKILVARGTKARLEEIKSSLETYQIVYATDTSEIGVKKANGNVDYFPDTVRLENMASKLYGADNLAIPDLEGKEYLGDGNYRLYDDNGITVDYNVFNGIFTINGTKTSNDSYVLYIFTDYIPIGQYALSYHYVSGSLQGQLYLGNTPVWNISIQLADANYMNYHEQTNTQNNRTRLYFDFVNSISFDNFQFKLKLEKGDTATPYTIPAPFLLPNDIPAWAKTTPPSAVRYMQMNANNTVTWRTAAQLRGDIGAATPANITTAVSTHNESPTAHASLFDEKQDKLVAGDSITIDENNVIEVDLNEMAYFDYAGSIYGDKYSLLLSAWEHSLTVVTVKKAQYPNGETECVIIPHGVTSISAYAFQNWSANNQPLVIPHGVTSIGSSAFSSWSSNNHPLTIPNSVTSIGTYAFLNWKLVPYVEIQAVTPPTLSNANAFSNQNDAPIYVPDASVTAYKTATNWVSLADRIFPISGKLVGGGVDPNSMAYFDYAGKFYGDKYSLLADAWEHSLTVNPSEISVNGSSANPRGTAQYPNGEAEGVIIPHGVTSIGNAAFYGWSSNNQPLIIPHGVTSIGAQAFANWTSNNQPLVIPNSVTSIGYGAFSGWSLVPYVEIRAITPPTISSSIFNGQNDAPIYVPDDSVDDYKTVGNWVSLADRIFPISDKDNTYTKGEIDLMIGDIESALDAILGV